MSRSKGFWNVLLLSLSAGLILSLITANHLAPIAESQIKRIYTYLSSKKPQHITYDEAGVPMVYYQDGLGKKYNIVAIAEEALRFSRSENKEVRQRLLVSAEWLRDNAVELNDSSLIYYNYFDWNHYGMKAPWRSAMSQGRVMQAYLAAARETGDSSWIDLARLSMNTLLVPVSEGGVSYLGEDGWWYEEYADDSAEESRVLNGMIVVLEGLMEYHRMVNDSLSLQLFRKGSLAVKNSLYRYDLNGHSAYDITGKPASDWYHLFHIRLLDFLYRETADPAFKQYREKWAAWKSPGFLERFIQKPKKTASLALLSLFLIYSFAVYLGISGILKILRKQV